MSDKYIIQSDCPGGGCCYPIALCNAMKWWGTTHPRPGGREWEILIDVAGCRHGSVISIESVDRLLGVVVMRRLPDSLLRKEDRLPLLVTIQDPILGMHTILVTGRDGDMVEVVNYKGEYQQWVQASELEVVHEEMLAGGYTVAWVVPAWRPE